MLLVEPIPQPNRLLVLRNSASSCRCITNKSHFKSKDNAHFFLLRKKTSTKHASNAYQSLLLSLYAARPASALAGEAAAAGAAGSLSFTINFGFGLGAAEVGASPPAGAAMSAQGFADAALGTSNPSLAQKL